MKEIAFDMSQSELEYNFILEDEAATLKLGSDIAAIPASNGMIALFGDLGIGKTVFARGFIHSFEGVDEVVSPTFSLLQLYEFAKIKVYHYDLYRINSPDEIIELGIFDAINDGITLVEWPERMDNYFPKNRLDIYLSQGLMDASRAVKIVGHGEFWETQLRNLFTK